MTHYVCTGSCGAVSKDAGFCQEETCAMYGAPLVTCECTDGNHDQAMMADQSNLESDDDSLDGMVDDLDLSEFEDYEDDKKDY